MKQIIIIFILFLSIMTLGLGAVTISVPGDYDTIQEGINASVDGDSVLVAPGIYYENIDFIGKGITVCSWYATTLDTSYISLTVIDGGQNGNVVNIELYNITDCFLRGFTIQNGYYSFGAGICIFYGNVELDALVIQNNYSVEVGGGIYCSAESNILMTNIVVSDNYTEGYGGGIFFNSSNFIASNIEVYGNHSEGDGGGVHLYESSGSNFQNFNIHDNESEENGGGISLYNAADEFYNLTVNNNNAVLGGGIYFEKDCNPVLEQVSIFGNSANQGGGMYIRESIPELKFVQVRDNSAEQGGGIYFEASEPVFDPVNRCSIYRNHTNVRDNGADMYSEFNVEVYLDTFTVMYPTNFHISPLENFTCDIWHSMFPQIAADLYVSVDGDNSNSGLIPSDPLQTIEYANSIILSDIYSPKTIYLADGIYSFSTNGECFPVCLTDYISLRGNNSEDVIIDAEGTTSVMILHDLGNIAVSGITLRNGNALRGGGINLESTNLTLEDVKILNNHAEMLGAGLYLDSGGQINLEGVEIRNNACDYWGGGIYTYLNEMEFSDVVITGNSSVKGGGIYTNQSIVNLSSVSLFSNTADFQGGGMFINSNSAVNFDEENRCNIYLNCIGERGLGNDIYSIVSGIDVVVDTFSVMTPTIFFLSPLDHFSWDIHHGYIQSISSDLYVSATGDDANIGTSWDEAFKTIHHACAVIFADSANHRTIHLANGTYSSAATGELFPICLPDYVILCGESQEGVILDGENQSRIFLCEGDVTTEIQNLTVQNGTGYNGGGIYCHNSSASFEDITVRNCYSTNSGGGIYVESNAMPIFRNVTIESNVADYRGGGISCDYNTNALFENLIVQDNSASSGGGVCCCNYSNVIFEDLTVQGNSASSGGGILCMDCDNVQINGLIVDNNTASGNGGGIYCRSKLNINNGIISNNSGANGGGIAYLYNDEAKKLKNVQIVSNGCSSQGGGILCIGDSLQVENCLLFDNVAMTNGGGIYFNYANHVSLRNLTISGNTAEDSGGGLFYLDHSDCVIMNSIFWENEPSEIHLRRLYNSINVMMGYSDFDDIINNLIIENNANFILLTGNIDQDPLFINAEQGNFFLNPDSPCINAGTAYYEYEDEVLINLDDDEYWGSAPDMGAFEYGMVAVDEFIIQNSKLKIQNYPNPFNPETQITFSLPETEHINLSVYNLKGQLVKILADEILPAGENNLIWNGKNELGRKVSSGIYLLMLKSRNKTATKKIMLIK